MLQRILDALPAYRYQVRNELKTQAGIAQVLGQNAIAFERERIELADRFDFFVDGIVIEVKRAGSFAEALRQAERYCQSRIVTAVVLASTKSWPPGLAATFNQKPVHVVRLPGLGL